MKISKELAVALTAVCIFCSVSCTAKPEETEATTESEVTEEETTGEESSETATSVSEEETTDTTAEEADTSAPLWLEAPDNITVETGTDFDVGNYISYIDDYDSSVDIAVDGEVDASTVGEYPLTVVLTDDAGNTTSKSINVKVIEPLPPSDDVDDGSDYVIDYYYFSDLITKYDDGKVMFGVDISKYQGDVDFEKMKAAGCDFVIMRAMVYYKGELLIDDKFKKNIVEALHSPVIMTPV